MPSGLPAEKRRHRSGDLDPDNPAPLASLLGQVESYGFSFAGFSSKITGRLCMDEFEIRRSAE
jgi:hypothetical protein